MALIRCTITGRLNGTRPVEADATAFTSLSPPAGTLRSNSKLSGYLHSRLQAMYADSPTFISYFPGRAVPNYKPWSGISSKNQVPQLLFLFIKVGNTIFLVCW